MDRVIRRVLSASSAQRRGDCWFEIVKDMFDFAISVNQEADA